MSKGLSKLQRRILAAIANVTVNTYGTDEPTEAKYQAVFHAVADYWWQGIPAIPGDARHQVAVSSFSRAVWSLVRRGLVGGVALAWVGIDAQSTDILYWQGGGRCERKKGYPRDRPRLKKLYLTERGWDERSGVPATAEPSSSKRSTAGQDCNDSGEG